MIVNRSNQFIFMHCRKAAGSSITMFLNEFLGPEDVQVGVWGDVLARGGRANRRFAGEALRGLVRRPRLAARLVSGLALPPPRRRRRIADTLNKAHKTAYADWSYPSHPTAREVASSYPEEWGAFLKFCVVRNPYERAVSDYLFRSRVTGAEVSFLDFLRRLEDPHREDPEGVRPPHVSNWPLYAIDDVVVMDYIIRFERLGEQFEEVCGLIGLDTPKALPVVKGSKKYDHAEFYDAESQRIVARVFEKEIDAFGYTLSPGPS